MTTDKWRFSEMFTISCTMNDFTSRNWRQGAEWNSEYVQNGNVVLQLAIWLDVNFEISLRMPYDHWRNGVLIELLLLEKLRAPPRAGLSRLVLCCIEAKCCKQILILLHLSRPTRHTHFCTAPISFFAKIQRNTLQEMHLNKKMFVSISFFAPMWRKFPEFYENFSKVHR